MLRTLLPSPPPPRATPVPTPAPAPVRRWLLTLLPLVGLALLYLAASRGPAIFDQNEGQYAGAVREMMDRPGDYLPSTHGRLERGHWNVPTNDGIPRLQKPPLVYWLMLGSMRVFGVNDFAARLPNAVFSLLWLGGVFLLGVRLGGARLGAAAATILGTMAGTFIFTHLIAPEPFLAAFLTGTFWCFLSACRQPARAGRWLTLAWVFMGLGVASKGLHGALYPLAVAGFLAWRHPETRPVWRKLALPAGPLLALALLVPWYAAVEARYPGFLRDQFLNEQWGHVVNRRYPLDSDRVPLGVFALEHLVLFLPWTFFLPAAWRSRSTRTAPDRARGDRRLGWDLLACWFGVTAVSLLFSSLQDYYLLTAWPPVAFWLARAWTHGPAHDGRALPRWMRLGPGWCLAGVGGLVLLAGLYLSWHGLGAHGSAAASSDRDTILGTLAGFSASAWHRLLPLIWAAGAVFVGGGLAVVALAARGRWPSVLPATALMMLVLLALAARGLGVLEDYFSLKRLALTINHQADPGALVVCAGEPCDNPSLLFYVDREISWWHADPSREFASRELRIGSELFLNDADLAHQWNSPRTVYLIGEADEFAHWQATPGPFSDHAHILEQRGTRVLVRNR